MMHKNVLSKISCYSSCCTFCVNKQINKIAFFCGKNCNFLILMYLLYQEVKVTTSCINPCLELSAKCQNVTCQLAFELSLAGVCKTLLTFELCNVTCLALNIDEFQCDIPRIW